MNLGIENDLRYCLVKTSSSFTKTIRSFTAVVFFLFIVLIRVAD